MHIVSQLVDFRHAAVVREINTLGLERAHEFDGRMHGIRFEVHRCGRREDEGFAVDIQFAIRQPEGVAGKDRLRSMIDDRDMVPRMARRIENLQRTFTQG